ncbi:MAG: hypothetical protein DRN95_07725, partial [Candidatus Hydrothermarchaeota archaeon]
MLNIYKESLEAEGCFTREYPTVFKSASEVIPGNIPEKMRLLMTATELTVFAGHLRKPIMWHGSTIPVNMISFLVGGSGCVDNTTEYLTRTGWKTIDSYTAGEEVLSWDSEFNSEFVVPDAYVVNNAKTLTRYNTPFMDMCLSDNHNMALLSPKRTTPLCKMTSAEFKAGHLNTVKGSSLKLPFNISYPSNTAGIKMTDAEIRLFIAYVADGTKTAVKNQVRIRVKKEYKKRRLRKLLTEVYGNYKESSYPSEPDYSYFFFKP